MKKIKIRKKGGLGIWLLNFCFFSKEAQPWKHMISKKESKKRKKKKNIYLIPVRWIKISRN